MNLVNHTASAYTLEELSKQYKQADLRPQPKHDLVEDEEVFWLLNEKLWFWPWIFWGIIIIAFLLVGVIGE